MTALQQQHPPTAHQNQEGTEAVRDVDMKKASAKENLAFLTSGAKEKLDKTFAGMKGAAHTMTHPFNKEAKKEATAKTIERKNGIADKQERIRATAHMQLLEEKAAADGVGVGPVDSGRPDALAPNGNGEADPEFQQLNNDSAPAASGRDESVDSGPRDPGRDTEQGTLANGDKMSEESSDGSSRGRAQALNQITPDSQDYQSG